MSLWVDKHRPQTFSKLDFHNDLGNRLQNLVSGGDFPHLLFYGPSGAGKKTRILALLREIYGSGVEKVKVEMRTFKIGSRKVEMPIISSSYHIELNPAQAGNSDSVVIQEVLKDIAQSGMVHDTGKCSFKVVVLSEVDSLSRGAQSSLRRTMEKYIKCCRLILCCESKSRVIDPIQSRCLNIRVSSPNNEMIIKVLDNVCQRERLLPNQELNERIAEASEGNLRRAILALEACKCHRYPFDAQQEIQLMDWEHFIQRVALEIINQQDPKTLLMVRGKMYELLSNCIPAQVILETLARELVSKSDDRMKAKIYSLAAISDQNLRNGTKDIFHLEAFVARFMSVYKRWLVEQFGGDFE